MKLFIFGASEFAHEIAQLAQQCGHEVSGFIEDEPAVQGSDRDGIHIHSWMDVLATRSTEQFVIALGSPHRRAEISERCSRHELPLATLIHPSAQIDEFVEIGAGSIIADRCVVKSNTTVGYCVLMNSYTTIGRDSVIEDFVSIMPGVEIGKTVHIKQGAYIGTNAVIRNRRPQLHSVIGENATIGMGAVIWQSVPAGAREVGNTSRAC